ncbi:MAG: phosphatidylglycerol lysyltransferase domain-containing protein [Candidatus Omnitrophica bacterium]|nr:phosphatidylglycerol lysyltransferase domain-containing protein [Candidatus Omnitrophota bacterium]MDD5611135.1 phosphatidylglycerol lysyltransferase domain-containing protein [Candidatus Omnitrophota bacterium]
MKLRRLKLTDKPIFEKYLKAGEHSLSTYAFANIYIWQGLFKISWSLIEENLCIFFRDNIGCFMYLPPLGKNRSSRLVEKCFTAMDSLNVNRAVSRIENIEEKDVDFYKGSGYNCFYKTSEYLCLREKLIDLKGNAFKSKRWAYNYFIKNYSFTYGPLARKDKAGCLLLYETWMRSRESGSSDAVYRGMLKDSLAAQKIALDNHRRLGLVARVVKVSGKISAYTLGFALNHETFCILFEITDLKIKGLAQFIFREFSRELAKYKYINIMDDLGLENLTQVKLSYKPIKTVGAYVVERNG